MITKLADALLQEHQQRVLDRLKDPDLPGLIAYHSMGSGKTLTALKALQDANARTGKRGLFIVPASLVENARKEINKHNLPLSDNNLDIKSYDWAVRHVDDLAKTPRSMVVFDEAHRLRNANTKRVQNLSQLANQADKVLMLTGTAGYNDPADISSLVKIINSKSKVPTERNAFWQRYVTPDLSHLQNTDELKSDLGKYIDIYQKARDNKDFPSVDEKIYRIPMSDVQSKVYRFVENKLPPHLRKSVRNRLPLTLQDSNDLNMFATGVRQAAVSPMHHNTEAHPEDSPKLLAAVNNMVQSARQPGFRGIAYSNYIDAGINPYAELLKKRGLTPLIYTGKLNARQKKELVDAYNSKDKVAKILLLSSSGGEGLDLKNTRKIQILEPHFNSAKIDQVIGRGARYQSHIDLPEDQRKVLVERYHSVMPKKWYHKLLNTMPEGAIDDYLFDAAQKKDRVIGEIRDLLK